jgi:hypothetical protein
MEELIERYRTASSGEAADGCGDNNRMVRKLPDMPAGRHHVLCWFLCPTVVPIFFACHHNNTEHSNIHAMPPPEYMLLLFYMCSSCIIGLEYIYTCIYLKALTMPACQDAKQETMVLQQEINLLQKGLR